MKSERNIFDDDMVLKGRTIAFAHKKKLLIVFVLLFIIIAVLLAGKGLSAKSITDYTTSLVSSGSIQKKVILSGEVKSASNLYAKSKHTGRINQIHVKLGDVVTSDTLIASFDISSEKRELAELQLDKTNKELNINQARFEQRQAELEYNNNVKKQQIQFDSKQKELGQSFELYNAGAISESDYRLIQDQFNLLQVDRKTAAERHKLSEELLNNKVELLQNELNAIILKINHLSEIIADENVYSQYEGVVKEVLIQSGDQVAQGMNLILLDSNQYDYEIKIPETNINDISVDQKVQVTFSDGSNSEGTVSKINHAIINDEKSNYSYITAKVIMDEENQVKLISGMTFQAKVILKEYDGIFVIPRSEYLNQEGNTYVFRVSSDGKRAEKVEITTGVYDEANMEVTGGLKAGDRILVSGYGDLKNQNSIKLK